MEKQIKASEFKAKCLKLMDEIALSGDELVITKNGKPVAKLVPAVDPQETRPSILGILKGKIWIREGVDLDEPTSNLAPWNEGEDELESLHEAPETFKDKP